jgi:hypothetical protein
MDIGEAFGNGIQYSISLMKVFRAEWIRLRKRSSAMFTKIAAPCPVYDSRIAKGRKMIEGMRTVVFQLHRAAAIRA